MAKVTKTTANGTSTYTEEETSLLDDVITGALAPVGLVSDDGTEFISKRAAGIGAVAWSSAAFLFGERWGHKRAGNGMDPFVGGPVMVTR